MLPRELRRLNKALKAEIDALKKEKQTNLEKIEIANKIITSQSNKLESFQRKLDDIISLRIRSNEKTNEIRKTNDYFYTKWIEEIEKRSILRKILTASVIINIGFAIFIINK